MKPPGGRTTDRGRGPVEGRVALRADHVLTMQSPDAEPIVDGTVVLDDGLITDLGGAAEMAVRHPGVPVTHLRGHALMPAFVNAHTHLAMTMFGGVADDRSLEDFLATVVPLESELLDHDVVATASVGAMVESHLAGVGTALDMYFFPGAVLEAAERCGFRALTGPVVLENEPPDAPGSTPEQRLEALAAWLADHPATDSWRPVVNPHSTYLVSPDHLRSAAELAARHDAVFHVHAAESAGEVATVAAMHSLHPIELLAEVGALGERTVVAHGVQLDESQIALLADSGTSVAHCPSSNLKLASGVAPVPQLLDAGVNVALGTDGSASSNDLDVLGAARLAALLHKTVGSGAPDPSRLDARTTLWMATRSGAAALGLGDTLGLLAPGAMADLVAVDLDGPHTQPIYDVHSSILYAAGRGDISQVWSAGRCVVRDGRHQLVDTDAVVSDLRLLGERTRGTL